MTFSTIPIITTTGAYQVMLVEGVSGESGPSSPPSKDVWFNNNNNVLAYSFPSSLGRTDFLYNKIVSNTGAYLEVSVDKTLGVLTYTISDRDGNIQRRTQTLGSSIAYYTFPVAVFVVHLTNIDEYYLSIAWTSIYDPPRSTVPSIPVVVGGLGRITTNDPGAGPTWSLSTSVTSISDSVARDFIGRSTYSVSFVTNGGSYVATLTGRTSLPDPLPTTTREGFEFTGWYTDSSLIFPAIPGATISEDTTLYAGWRPNQFTVTFETNGGEPVSQLTNVNQLPDPLPVTLKVGNDFAGWFTDSELLHPAVPGAFITQNTTLYAKWVEQQSTDIHVPTVSTPSLLQTGFVTMWNPTLEEVRQLSNFLWTTNLFDNLRKLFNDPMEAILFLGIVPFDVNTAERGNIYFGNLDTDVESTPIVQQYYTLDFGDIDMTEYYHSFLDYEPATTVEIFLPFCGTHKLSANEVMGSVMNLKYNVDVFTGTCVAMLTITKPGIDSVMYSFEGNVMATIPVTAKNYSDFLRSAVSTVASAIALGAMI